MTIAKVQISSAHIYHIGSKIDFFVSRSSKRDIK